MKGQSSLKKSLGGIRRASSMSSFERIRESDLNKNHSKLDLVKQQLMNEIHPELNNGHNISSR